MERLICHLETLPPWDSDKGVLAPSSGHAVGDYSALAWLYDHHSVVRMASVKFYCLSLT
jgi:hypothetical protein